MGVSITEKQIQSVTLIYFTASNTYLVLDKTTYIYFKAYTLTTSQKDFNAALAKHINNEPTCNLLHDTFYNLSKTTLNLDPYQCNPCLERLPIHVVFLQYNKQHIAINYDTLPTLDTVILKFCHLQTPQMIQSTTLNIKKNIEGYYLENNEGSAWNWGLDAIHLLQGKFSFEILNALHNKKEQDWIGTFHASTIGDGEQAVMLVGNSGSGKSTLATLLMYSGYDLIADDMSAMFADNNHIAVLPAAISVKEKAFSTLSTFITNFEDLPSQYINPNKGNVTYVPPLPLKHPKKLNYPCKNIVLVRYSHSPIPTTLTEGAEKKILEELISESWLANNETHALSFLNWLETVRFYELNYHNNEESIGAIGSLFKE
jgi:hypothetical protein